MKLFTCEPLEISHHFELLLNENISFNKSALTLKSLTVITKCDRNLLQIVTGITKFDKYHKVMMKMIMKDELFLWYG